jgi:hypothetical protein
MARFNMRCLDTVRFDMGLGAGFNDWTLNLRRRLRTRRLGCRRFRSGWFGCGLFFDRSRGRRSITAAGDPTADFKGDIIVKRAGMRLFVADA